MNMLRDLFRRKNLPSLSDRGDARGYVACQDFGRLKKIIDDDPPSEAPTWVQRLFGTVPKSAPLDKANPKPIALKPDLEPKI